MNAASADDARAVAVIEVGTTSIRMRMAQVHASGRIEPLDSLQQAVALGRDTFTQGAIAPQTVEDVVAVLRNFRRILSEYGIDTGDSSVRAVATSAVREASNRDAFVDRIMIATGLHIDVLEEAEVSRYTYLAISPYLQCEAALRKGHTLAVEVGGGSTEILVLSRGEVEDSLTYRLGSLRLRELLDDREPPTPVQLRLVKNQVDRSVRSIRAVHSNRPIFRMIALGGEARFAAALLGAEPNALGVAKVPIEPLKRLTRDILGRSPDDIVRRYHVSYPEADTLGISLLILVRLTQAFRVRSLRVGFSTLRDGIVDEMAAQGPWTDDMKRQVVHAAFKLGRKYHFEEDHAQRTAERAAQLYRALQDEHGLSPRHELILTTAALLHDIGLYISNRSHHKHSMYLILNGDLFGLGPRDLNLVALTARYHRRAAPRPTHEAYMALSRKQRIAVKKMAAILRTADALDRGQRRDGPLAIEVKPEAVVVRMAGGGDLALERFALQRKGPLFEEVYGKPVVLRESRRSKAT